MEGLCGQFTFRKNSDFYYPYSERLHRRPSPSGSQIVKFYLPVKEVLAQKRHLAMALISNCKMTRGAEVRALYIQDMVKVNIFCHDLIIAKVCLPQKHKRT